MEEYRVNIEDATISNNEYRNILYTGDYIQLIVMSIPVGGSVPLEIHRGVDQFVRVERGKAKVTVGGREYMLSKDQIIIIPSGIPHQIDNSGSEDLKIYTIYTSRVH